MKILLLIILLVFACVVGMALMTRLLRITQQLGDLRQQVARNDELLHRQMQQLNDREKAASETKET
jgi:cell division protein FtsB